ncbi:MAG TPA: hypothetical protein VE398_07925 [Acidobacteriota bacterium]|nr:hypothetical protein [Acidobacteriota bacterium]
MKTPIVPSFVFLLATLATSARSSEIPFERLTIDLGISETCAIADFNGDGRPDLFSGNAAQAAACGFRWLTSTATGILISPSAARVDYSCSGI